MNSKIAVLFLYVFVSISLIFGVTLDPAFNNFFGNNINNLNFQPFQNQALLFNGFIGSFGDTIGVGTQQVQNQAAGTNGVLNFNSQINTFAGLGISQAVSGQTITQTPTFAAVGGGALVALNGYSGPNGVIIPNSPGLLGTTTSQYTNINSNIFNPVDTQFGLTSAPLTLTQPASSTSNQQTGPNYHYVNIFNNSNYFAIVVILGSLCGIALGITSYIIYSSLASTNTLSISQQVLNKNLTKPLTINNNSTYSANPNNKHVPALATGV